MIIFKTGDLLKDDSQAIVNTVNCVGVMGKGIALQFKRAYPDNFKIYSDSCKRREVCIGRMLVVYTNDKYIINFPTKGHWRDKSKIECIKSGLKDLVCVIKDYNIKSISIPALGSGLGGLNWIDVKDIMYNELSKIENVDIFIYEPF